MSYRLIDNETNEDIIDKLSRIKDERDKYEKILYKIKEWLEEDLKQQYRDCGHRNNIIREVYNKLNELLEKIE